MVLTHDGRTVCSQPMNSQPVGARVEAAIDFLASPNETYQHWVDGGKSVPPIGAGISSMWYGCRAIL